MDRDRSSLTPGVTSRPTTGVRRALIALPVGFLVVFYLWPVATLVATVADLDAVRSVLSQPGLWRVVWFTTWQALASTVATVVVGLGPAHLVARWSFPGRRLLAAAITVPFLLPTVVVAAAFTALLPERLEHTATAIIIAHVFFNVAVVVRVVGGLWSEVPPDLTAAARTLGASPARASWGVTLPLLRPAITAAATITFLFSFTSFGVVQILGGPRHPTIEVEIARRATQLGDVTGAAVLSMMQLAILGVLVAVAARWQPRPVGMALAPVRRRVPTTPRQRSGIRAAALAAAAFVVVPLGALVVGSVRIDRRWTLVAWTGLGRPAERPGASLPLDLIGSVRTSAMIAAAATTISLVVGASAALAIASARSGGRALDVGVMLPLGTSAVTVGFGMLIAFDRAPVDWRGAPWLVPVAHSLIAIPFVVRTLLPTLRSRPAAWGDAAATLGATPTQAWWHIDVRRLGRPLVAAGGLAAAISLGEFGATTFLSRSGTETLPVVIGRLLGRAGDLPRAQAFALASMLAATTLALVISIDQLDPS